MEGPALDEWIDLDLEADASLLSIRDEGGRGGDRDPDIPDSLGSFERSESTTEATDWMGVLSPDALEDLDSVAQRFLD